MCHGEILFSQSHTQIQATIIFADLTIPFPLSACLSIDKSINQIYQPIYLSISQSMSTVYLSIYQSMHLSIYPSIYQSPHLYVCIYMSL